MFSLILLIICLAIATYSATKKDNTSTTFFMGLAIFNLIIYLLK